VLHVSDIHLNPQAFDVAAELVERFGVDMVVDTGDITDWGTQAESTLLDRIGLLEVPYVYVRGNHDSRATERAVAAQPNAVVLDGNGATVRGIRFFGLGDPRYTPDKGEVVRPETMRVTANRLRRLLRDADADVLLVHDPVLVDRVGGLVPLSLAGHRHEFGIRDLEGGGRLIVQGSSGGAGLRGFQAEEPEPLTMSVLYFDGTSNRLVALDHVTIRGIADPDVRVQRRVFRDVIEVDDDGAMSSG